MQRFLLALTPPQIVLYIVLVFVCPGRLYPLIALIMVVELYSKMDMYAYLLTFILRLL